jgi:tyrosyl-tRNA synthetase
MAESFAWEQTLKLIKKNVVDLTTEDELKKRLSGKWKPLRVKYGIDPTNPHLHLGHTVPLRKLRTFQNLGHTAVIIIGDFTACIGDPTGRDETRKMDLTPEQAIANGKELRQQLSKVINIDKAEVHLNGNWFRSFNFVSALQMMKSVTVQQILNRSDFHNRIANHSPISLHEIMYPLMQAHDSVRVQSDIELGGTEQLFTLMLARDFQIAAGLEPQICMTLPILRGTDGKKRMGKSLGNFIGVKEEPFSMFSKTMSIPDELLPEWLSLLTDRTIDDFKDKHPMEVKQFLASEIVKDFHNKEQAELSCVEWRRVFSERKDPSDIPQVKLSSLEGAVPDEAGNNSLPAYKLLQAVGLATSGNDARRLIEPGAMTIGTERRKVVNPMEMIPVVNGTIIRVGSRKIVQIKIEN